MTEVVTFFGLPDREENPLMAKYSKEQRDRAVDLYIKYEHSAADVIHELGYPSKGALLSWYADRLEEERTGVPSRRGERYRRYSDEQKQAAVDHYLEYGRGGGRGSAGAGMVEARPYHADAGISEKQGAAHGVDRRARARPAQAEARARARGTETRGCLCSIRN